MFSIVQISDCDECVRSTINHEAIALNLYLKIETLEKNLLLVA